MVTIKVPKEISSYETKLIGSFTTRQTICLIGLASACVFFYTLLQPIWGKDPALFACIIAAVPFAVCGWYRPYGMVAEQFFVCVIKGMFLAPAHRKYKNKNMYEHIQQAIKEENEAIETNNKKNKSKKKTAYKQSKLAIK